MTNGAQLYSTTLSPHEIVQFVGLPVEASVRFTSGSQADHIGHGVNIDNRDDDDDEVI
jgi:hypothetical protein